MFRKNIMKGSVVFLSGIGIAKCSLNWSCLAILMPGHCPSETSEAWHDCHDSSVQTVRTKGEAASYSGPFVPVKSFLVAKVGFSGCWCCRAVWGMRVGNDSLLASISASSTDPKRIHTPHSLFIH